VPETSSLVGLIVDETGLEISDQRRTVLRYRYAEAEPPVDNPLYRRSAFIHPIWAPNGAVLTRINPSDHIHHMGFWHPWTKTEYKGRKIDFWNLKEGQGTIRFSGFDAVDTGPVAASFTASHSYVDLTVPDEEEIALDETWTVTVWSGSAADTVFIWDLVISQSCATAAPFTILKYRYSGFGFRGTADWNEKNSNYLTSEGKTRTDGNGTRARWCDVYGQTDEGTAGILFLSHPDNHAHPEPMRIWPQGDVFFGFCPVESEDWQMQPGQKYIRHYRAVVHNGKLSPDSAEQFWLDYANPPVVKTMLNP
jgi:hypothetical protein